MLGANSTLVPRGEYGKERKRQVKQDMKKVRLKNTNLELSNICYGTANFGEKLDKVQAFRMLDAYVDLGGNFIDTANVYCKWVEGLGNSSEQYIGRWLKERNAYGKVVVATKGGHYDFASPGTSRVRKEEIRKDLEESLRTLGLDCIDFYWLHRDDEALGVEEIIDTMEDLVKEGRIRYYGASNYKRYRVEEALQYARKQGIQGFSAVSNQWSLAAVNEGGNMNSDPSLVMMDKEYYKWHKESGMPVVPFSSGAHGFFEKMYKGEELSEAMKRAYVSRKNLWIYETLCSLVGKYHASVHALSIAWLLNQPFQVFPAVSVSKLKQLEDLVKAGEIVFDQKTCYEISGISF